MDRPAGLLIVCALLPALLSAGCQSPYHSDQGAVIGGLGGAGVGALVGNAVGHTGAGAAIGAGVGALSGAVIGQGLDNVEARNRAMIEQQMQRPVGANPVTIDDVVNMTRAGVAEDLIVNHVRAHGVVRPLQAADLIVLNQQGVSPAVIRAMQEPPVPRSQPVIVQQPQPGPVIVEEYHYGYAPYWSSPYYHGCYHHRPPPRVGVGLSFHN